MEYPLVNQCFPVLYSVNGYIVYKENFPGTVNEKDLMPAFQNCKKMH